MSVWAIVVAGGSGTRFGGPKSDVLLAGARVVDRSVATARLVCDGVVLVVPRDGSLTPSPDCTIVVGGSTRAESVRNGLAVVPLDAQVIVVHDAARPLASEALFRRVIEAVHNGADAAITAVPIVDTIKRVHDRVIQETIDRSVLVAVQTPQAFRADALRAAHANGRSTTDDAALLEDMGLRVVCVDGDVRNRKLTTRDDLAVMELHAAQMHAAQMNEKAHAPLNSAPMGEAS